MPSQIHAASMIKTNGSDFNEKLDAIISETEDEDGFNSRKPLNVDVMSTDFKKKQTKKEKSNSRSGTP